MLAALETGPVAVRYIPLHEADLYRQAGWTVSELAGPGGAHSAMAWRRGGQSEGDKRAAHIDSLKTQRGGWTKKSLAGLGVPWPPPKGWRQDLIAGRTA